MKKLSFLLALSALQVFAASPAYFKLNRDACADFTVNNNTFCQVIPGFFQPGWQFRQFNRDEKAQDPLVLQPTAKCLDKNVKLDMAAKNTPNGLDLTYVITPLEDIQFNSLCVRFCFPAEYHSGISFQYDQAPRQNYPKTFQQIHVAHNNCTSFTLWTPDGTLRFAFAKPTPMMVQDSRQWSGGMELRVGPSLEATTAWPAGKALDLSMKLSWDGGLTAKPVLPVILEANDEWIPLDTRLGIVPGSALDFSGMGFTDGPAGKYGWVKAVGDHFEFEKLPGVNQRFYGVNLCFSAHDLTHEQSELLAERFWRLGYNTVRYHHYEKVFQDTSKHTSTVLNPKQMEKLDYFHACLRKRGIYLTTDTFVSRRIFAKEIFPDEPNPGKEIKMNDIKMLIPVNENAFANWKSFCQAFFGHRNPYTGLTYAQDPALAWISLINEGNFGNFFGSMSDRVKAEWLKAWKAWLDAKYQTSAKRNAAWGLNAEEEISNLPTSQNKPEILRDFERFQYDTERRMLRRMTQVLRDELGSKALFTDMNSWIRRPWTQIARMDFDYVDDHFYIDHPRFIETPWHLPSRCANTSLVRNGLPGGSHIAFTRIFGKPYTISEYNFAGPSRYRSVSGLMTGCLAALQDWAGVWRFAYSHSNGNLFQPGTAGYLDLATDPLNQCSERAFLCLFMRGDLKPLTHSIAITASSDYLDSDFQPNAVTAPSWQKLNCLAKVGYAIAPKNAKLDLDLTVGLDATSPKGREALDSSPLQQETGAQFLEQLRKHGWISADNPSSLQNTYLKSANGQLFMDGPQNTLTLNTNCTAGGFAPAGGTITTDAATIQILDTDATLWISSLDAKAIPQSQRLLLTHLTDLQNTNVKFADDSFKIQQTWGKLPHLVRKGRAEVLLRLPATAKVQVWALRTNGERTTQIPVEKRQDGILLKLDVKGSEGAQMMYEIEVTK